MRTRPATHPRGEPAGARYTGSLVTAEPNTSSPDDIFVEEMTSVAAEDLAALQALLPELSSSAPTLTLSDLETVVGSPATVLFVARRAGRLVGSLTLVVFSAPTGPRAWIEDVVVSPSERGGGIGAALVQAALKRASDSGSRTVDLTSRPSRQAANRLYVRLGFELRQTNVYRYSLE
jgi:ribosomal protein S18 acetylase RimI-like enzyme